MSNLLEKSLDDIIRDTRGGRESRGVSKRPAKKQARRGTPARREAPVPRAARIPASVEERSHGRPLLRVKNIDHRLTEEDLVQLFGRVGEVEFAELVKDLVAARPSGVAYVQFALQPQRYNAEAIAQFHGKPALGRTLVVESARGLVERLGGGAGRREQPAKKKEPRQRAPKEKAKREHKLVEELDAELNAYLGGGDESVAEPVAEPVAESVAPPFPAVE